MSIREIAARAGVSIATVSRYLADKNGISATSRKKIEDVLASEGECALPHTRRKPATIALLLPRSNYQYYQCAVQELTNMATAMKFRMLVLPAMADEQTGWYEMLKMIQPQGVIGLTSTLDSEVERWWQENPKASIVLLGEETRRENVNVVRINDLIAAYEGTNYLLGLGHRKICFFSNYPHDVTTSFQRLAGAQRAMTEAGKDIVPHIRYKTLTYSSGYELAKQLAQKREGYTAIFAFSDEMALGAINALLEEGLRVPEDISVLGIDDLPIASMMRPALTTIHQPLASMIKETLELLRTPSVKGRAVILPHKLVERDTCIRIEEGERN